MSHLRGRQGFTLIEMVVVLLIVGLLAALVGPAIFGQAEEAKRKTAKVQVKGFAQSIRMFALDTGRLPTAAEGLRVLIPPPPTDVRNYNPAGYLEERQVPLDPWGNPYDYRPEGAQFTVVSYGKDGVPSGDDITNWAQNP